MSPGQTCLIILLMLANQRGWGHGRPWVFPNILFSCVDYSASKFCFKLGTPGQVNMPLLLCALYHQHIQTLLVCRHDQASRLVRLKGRTKQRLKLVALCGTYWPLPHSSTIPGGAFKSSRNLEKGSKACSLSQGLANNVHMLYTYILLFYYKVPLPEIRIVGTAFKEPFLAFLTCSYSAESFVQIYSKPPRSLVLSAYLLI